MDLRVVYCSFAIALFWPSVGWGDGAARDAWYVGWPVFDERIRIVLPEAGSTEGQVWLGEDSTEVVPFCEARADFFCFRASRYAFAVPKGDKWGDPKWQHEDILCEVRDRDLSVQIFGRRLSDLTLIRCAAEGVEERSFLYSRRDGLIAIDLGGREWKATYWLEGTSGVGAAAR